MAFLKISNLKKSFGAVNILKGIDLELDKGGFLVLVGPSGCGKSTLLNTIAGLESITSGDISINGRVINELHPSKRDIAMVFQSYALYPNMTVGQNIAFALEMRGVPKAEREAAVDKVAKTLQITHLLDRKPSQLSGGQRQRVAMGRALVRDPSMFLFDEPLSNLDAKLRVDMRIEIKRLHQATGTTIVYVTHDQIEAMTLADRIVIMDKGAIQQIGTPDQIYSDPANTFVAGFIGQPPMNLIAGTALAGTFTAQGVRSACPTHLSGKVTLGIRPEDCRVGGDNVRGLVYGVEPTGDVTYLTITTGARQIEVKAARDFRADIDTAVGITFDPTRLYFFDEQGQRIRGVA